jgi:hypothetical protein
MDQLDNRVDETLQMLRSAAIEAEMVVSGDGRISECNAAKLLGVEAESLAKRRVEGKAPSPIASWARPIKTSGVSMD